jgi:DNA-binding NtrC family response regulator
MKSIVEVGMKTLRILMVEDDAWVGYVLEDLIAEASEDAQITVTRSVASAEKQLSESKFEFDFAFLDVNVNNGKTYGIAASLVGRDIPFAFMSGFVLRHEVPEHLRHAPFLAKPYRSAQIKSILSSVGH